MGERPLRFGLTWYGRVEHHHSGLLAQPHHAELASFRGDVLQRTDWPLPPYAGDYACNYRCILDVPMDGITIAAVGKEYHGMSAIVS